MIRTPYSILLACLLPALALAAPSLKVGDPAPPLKVGKWLKGAAVEKFDPSLVYVVEFWATWCGPCKQNIPHLTALAKQQQGKARVIGVSIWEAEKTDHAKRIDTLEKFVASMGDRMDYTVAADDNEGSMGKTWMEAAGENGIPTAFVIGKDGRIAWIGHPWQDMDKVVAQAVEGTLDPKAMADQAAERQKDKDEKAKRAALFNEVNDLAKQNKHAEAVAALDKLVAAHPELGPCGYTRYRLLRAYDEPAAWKLARTLLEGEFKDNASGLYGIGRDLTDPPGPKNPDWDLAVAVGLRANELGQSKNPSYLSVLAEAYAGKGDLAKAVETGDLAVKLARESPDYPKGSADYIARRIESFKRRLQEKPAP